MPVQEFIQHTRRLSAISVAARVSSERLEDGSVGYAIRGESKQGKNTKLLFCTTGVVLRRLGSGDSLENVSHIVVDEVCSMFIILGEITFKRGLGPRTVGGRGFSSP